MRLLDNYHGIFMMPTPLDRAMNSKNLFLGFAGMISAAAVWAIWGSDMFPEEQDPTGNPEDWTADELKRWLRVRGLLPNEHSTREELLERVKANLRIPRPSPQSSR